MALTSVNWTRPKLAVTLNEALAASANIADLTTKFAVDVHATVNSLDKVLFRTEITPVYEGSNVKLEVKVYKFAGTAAVYSAGGTTPANSVGTLINTFTTGTLDLDAFYTAAGDTRTNS